MFNVPLRPLGTQERSMVNVQCSMEYAHAYITNSVPYIGRTWKAIPDSLFREFKTTGNRTHYEDACFALRKQFANLAMGEIMEQQGRFIPDIVRGLRYFKDEVWWGIPAHYPKDHPERDIQVVDLFNAETANMLAWAVYMLHDQLEAAQKGITDTIRSEIVRRMLIPALHEDYSWKHSADNWNPWICENWLSCVLLCEDAPQRRDDAIAQIATCLQTFYDLNPDDGGCDEGIFYWERAAASLFQCLILSEQLRATLNTSLSKLRNMARYVFATYISYNTYVNFADAQTYFCPKPNILFPIGRYLEDDDLLGFAATIAQRTNLFNDVRNSFSDQDFPSLSRELLFLADIDTWKSITPREPAIRDSYLPNSQIFTARDSEGTTDGLFVAMKGGNNAEHHNHNDVGHFVVYADAKPLLIDIGRCTYTAQAATHRYEHFNMRSAYHNVPLVNGTEQKAGKQYKATLTDYSSNDSRATMTLDLTDAYPAEAQLSHWQRIVTLHRGNRVEINENYRLKRYQQPTELVLVSCGNTRLITPGRIAVDVGSATHYISYNPRQLTPVIELIQTDDPLILKAWQNSPLYRVRLIVNSHSLRGNITYSVER